MRSTHYPKQKDSLDLPDDARFTKRFWTITLMVVFACFVIVISLIILGMVAVYKEKYGELNHATMEWETPEDIKFALRAKR